VLDASSQWPGDSLIAESREVPARWVLAQYPVPVTAVADDGAVLFANAAFAEEFGCSRHAVTSISCDDVPLFEGLMECLSRRAEPRGAPLEVRSARVPDNPHEQRGHAMSVALAGPV
jgi:PAS domain-containing protein